MEAVGVVEEPRWRVSERELVATAMGEMGRAV
jgi:hypothetical protein